MHAFHPMSGSRDCAVVGFTLAAWPDGFLKFYQNIQNVAAIDGIVKVNRKLYSIGPREWGSSWTWLDNYVVRFDKISLELTRRRLIYARTFVSLLSSHPTLIFWVKKYLWVEFFPVVSNKVKLLGDGVSLGEMSSWLLDYVWNICPFTIYRNENLPKSKQ